MSPFAKRLLKKLGGKVDIGGLTLRISIGDYRKDKIYGDCDLAKERIRLCSMQSDQNMVDTLIHEVLHAISDKYRLQLKHRDVYVISTALSGVLKKLILR